MSLPDFRHIIPADLASTARTLALHADAVRRGLADGSDAGRLAFVAAVEHSRRVTTGDGCGLLAAIVRGRRGDLVTQGDEDRARCRLRDWERGEASEAGRMMDRTTAGSRDRGGTCGIGTLAGVLVGVMGRVGIGGGRE